MSKKNNFTFVHVGNHYSKEIVFNLIIILRLLFQKICYFYKSNIYYNSFSERKTQ